MLTLFRSSVYKIVTMTFEGRLQISSRRVANSEYIDCAKNTMDYPEEVPFLCLNVDLPPVPLFQDERKQSLIPQVPLLTILNKFDGKCEHEYKTYKENFMKRYRILRLPEYIIIYYQRFTRNNFYLEKNNTIVNFPIKDVDFGFLIDSPGSVTYNLIANIVHEGEPNKGTYRIHVLHKSTGTWFEMQDLHVIPIPAQMITLSEAYLQIWERVKNTDN
ncbi:hypothetical protein ACOME3_002505 [Neoechinorhynchus agilis]